MDVLASASFVLQNEALTQNRLATDVNALATGLRVRSAADDPSGYTIANTIQTKAAGLQQSVTNVQTANNLLNVADGALSNIELILQRVRSLTVEANSDINSESDLQNIQAEINQMLLEINKISSEVNFNGLTLFNGQFQQPGAPNSAQVLGLYEYVTPPYPNAATNQTGTNNLASGGQFVTVGNITIGSFVPAFTVFSIVSASNNMVDPDSGVNIGPGVLIQETSYSTSGGFGPTPLFVDYSAIPDNTPIPGAPINAPYGLPPTFSGALLFTANFGSLNASDVGAQVAIITQLPTQQPTNGHALAVNDGGQEGLTISVSLPEINTNTLNISNISVLQPDVTRVVDSGGFGSWQVSGQSNSNNMPASYAEIQVDAAIEQVNAIRAQVGAQVVATQIDANNNNTTIVAEQASVSNIRDADIGATVTDFTKQQILVSVGNSVLAQLHLSSTQVTALLLNSFAGPVIA
jgi:flagellin